MLDNLEKFIEYISKHRGFFEKTHGAIYIKEKNLYCYKCKDDRRFTIGKIYSPVDFKVYPIVPPAMDSGGHAFDRTQKITNKKLTPSLFKLQCLQCDSIITALICEFNGKPELLVLPSDMSDVGTINTKKEVKFYIDQAYKCQMIGAYSAAITMYRAALEMLLFTEGYKKRTLEAKIIELEKQISKGTAPDWALNLDTEILRLIKTLGNFSIHPNDGDIDKQKTFDKELISGIKTIFGKLLYKVYESKLREVESKKLLKDAEKKLKKLTSP